MEGAKGWGGELLEKFIIITNVLFIIYFDLHDLIFRTVCLLLLFLISIHWFDEEFYFLSLVSLLCLFCCFILVAERWKRMKTCCALIIWSERITVCMFSLTFIYVYGELTERTLQKFPLDFVSTLIDTL